MSNALAQPKNLSPAPNDVSSGGHWRVPEEQIGNTAYLNNQTPVVFKFSESEVLGATPWFTKLRAINFSRFAATAFTGFSGLKEKSNYRFLGAVVGIYSNIVNIVFGAKKGPIAGALQLAAGEWKEEGEYRSQFIKGHMPQDILDALEKMLNECEIPPKSVQINSTPEGATLRIKSSVFDEVQRFLHAKLDARQEAMRAVCDQQRLMLGSEAGLVGGIKLEGMSDLAKKELENIVELEWRVPGYVAKDASQISWLHIAPEHQKRFAEKCGAESSSKVSSITVRRKYESPSGVFEAILRPDKYPFQNGLLLGGVLSNALRVYAGLKGDQLSNKQPITKEIEGSVISMLAYFIEGQKEIRMEKDLYAPTDRHADEGRINNMANKTFTLLNERPLLAAVPLKAWMLVNRMQDAWEKKRDKITGELRRDNNKVVSVSFDALSAILTASMQKNDYGG